MIDDIEKKLREIDKLLDEASELAINMVKIEARKILQADPDLHEFIMAMGDCFFTYKDGSKYDMMRLSDEEYEDIEGSDMDYWGRVADGIIHDRSIHEDFFDMIDYLDERFRVCGYPVRLTANSKEVHHWGDTRKNPVKYVPLKEESCND